MGTEGRNGVIKVVDEAEGVCGAEVVVVVKREKGGEELALGCQDGFVAEGGSDCMMCGGGEWACLRVRVGCFRRCVQ